jgi:hypothetical protein
VETVFGASPWEADPERPDPLAEALETWTRQAILGFLGALRESGADLWLVHDRAVLFGGGALALGPWEDAWVRQLRTRAAPEVSDPLAGLDPLSLLAEGGDGFARKERWLWPVAPQQRHVVEALAQCRRGAGM